MLPCRRRLSPRPNVWRLRTRSELWGRLQIIRFTLTMRSDLGLLAHDFVIATASNVFIFVSPKNSLVKLDFMLYKQKKKKLNDEKKHVHLS